MSSLMNANTVRADSRPPTHIRVVVHTLGPATPTATLSDNHWSIYLRLAGDRSVRINMRAEYGNPAGILEWTAQAYDLTFSAIRYWDFPVTQGVTVGHVAQLVYTLNRHKYDMSGGGSGCRYWVYVIMSDLAQQGYTAANAAAQLWPDLLYRYHTSNERKPLHMVQGEFL
ncbi:MAG: hypothetical protein M1837_000338 [Sclerophora amabilis]|nr:MAG: hypothetical protein M1837_000338 [Sclerophora amabilis]